MPTSLASHPPPPSPPAEKMEANDEIIDRTFPHWIAHTREKNIYAIIVLNSRRPI